MKINRSEVFRYMGWRRGEPTDTVSRLAESICTEFEESIVPKYSYKPVSVTTVGNKVILDSFLFDSNALAKHLRDTKFAIVISATLGTEADKTIKLQALKGTLNAAIAQAAGAAMIEDFLDEVTKSLEQEYRLTALPRFSPGYGDWELSNQEAILALTDAKKRCGITLTESYMMLPTKSVTAVIGFSENTKQEKHSCENCDKKDCEYRK